MADPVSFRQSEMKFCYPKILGGNVTLFATHKALKSIAWRDVDF